MMRASATWIAIATLAACGDDQSKTLNCGMGTSGVLTDGQPVVVVSGDGNDLKGAAIAAGTGTTIPTQSVSIECAADIVPAGYTALGPAVTFGPEGTWSDRAFLLTLPYKAARMPKGAERRHVRIVAKRAGHDAYFPMIANRKLDDDNDYASRATFKAGELTTYQVVIDNNAGKPETRMFTWRAITGISMGGNASMAIALRHPDRFDTFADLGGEPGPSMVYTLGMVRDFLFGGFCDAEDEAAGRGAIGQLCPTKAGINEIPADFEHMIYQKGDGVGLTLTRHLYMKASRDLARALSNPAIYSASNPYLPPGVPDNYITQDTATRCADGGRVKLDNFFDREFNPSGSYPVITFCDGSDGPTLGNAVFDPNVPGTDPAEILLAVDLNDNGKRDQGEPVITNAYEPFSDVGTDALADDKEPGYDATANPDPNGDDYHPVRNPLGTEGNHNYEAGEPYDDFGLDGVDGTCQQGTPGCYDWGEGNGHWDLSPNVARWYDNDLNVLLAKLTDEQRHHMSMWFDAGIRDFLDNSVSANAAVGEALARYGMPLGVYDNFSMLDGGTTDLAFDFLGIPWADFPKNGYLRYGDPDATQATIEGGDGRHVGTANQIIYRAQTAFAWMNRRWPGGDLSDTYDSGKIIKDLTFTSPNTGRVSPFGLFLPPGYDKPENADKTYPVIYFLHGYGMQPMDLADLSSVFALNMVATNPLDSRFQKFIIVYVDGRCRPDVSGVPVPSGGDGCEGGTFYVDAPAGGQARMEQNLLDLMDYIDANYRTKPPGPGTVVD